MQRTWRKLMGGAGSALTAGCMALAVGGCSTELDGFGTKPSAAEANRIDQSRVLAAPTGSVEATAVPAPTGAQATSAAEAVTPRAAANIPLTPPPANPGGVAYAPSAAKEQLSGAWSFSWDNGRSACPLTLSTTRGLSGMAAQADVSCPSDIFMTKGWDMMGSDLVLQNHQGKITARLRPSGANRYVGVMADTNQQVVLSR